MNKICGDIDRGEATNLLIVIVFLKTVNESEEDRIQNTQDFQKNAGVGRMDTTRLDSCRISA